MQSAEQICSQSAERPRAGGAARVVAADGADGEEK